VYIATTCRATIQRRGAVDNGIRPSKLRFDSHLVTDVMPNAHLSHNTGLVR